MQLNRKDAKDAKEDAEGVGKGLMGVVTSYQMNEGAKLKTFRLAAVAAAAR